MSGSCVKICDVGGKGFFLPTPIEQQLEPAMVRGFVYLGLLLWILMGISIVSDNLMSAVQKITSKQMRRFDKESMTHVTVNVWNETLANLTLMAVGFRAPELLLTTAELVRMGMFSGQIGPLAVTGSAAFNLLLIAAVCNQSVEEGQAKAIKDLGVFVVTSAFSILAYAWVYVVVSVYTPNVVDIEEGAAGVGLYIIMLIVAYFAAVGCPCCRNRSKQQQARQVALEKASAKDLAAMEMHILAKFGSGLSDDQMMELIEQEYGDKASSAKYRINASKNLSGGKRLNMPGTHKESEEITELKEAVAADEAVKRASVEFLAQKYSVIESIGTMDVIVCRSADTFAGTVLVQYKTRDGTASSPGDYAHVEGTLEFTEAGQQLPIRIQIIDDDAAEEDEEFFVDLLEPTIKRAADGGDEVEGAVKVGLGDKATCSVRIIDDDMPGIIRFPQEQIVVKEEYAKTTVPIEVLRANGSQGLVSCKYRTEDATATARLDYGSVSGLLEFKDGQCEATINVVIKPRMQHKRHFRLVLEEPSGGAEFPDHTDGGKQSCVLTVIIEPDEVAQDRVERVAQKLRNRIEKAEQAQSTWKDQFLTALLVNGGDDEAEVPPPFWDYLLHIITLVWKFLFALIPPVEVCGGWLTFLISLCAVGVLIAFVSDLASLLGCYLEVPDSIAAITLIAIGLSYPDTFASQAAAIQDPAADASIGMAPGNNAVSVFLGIGLPWLAGSLWWKIQGSTPEWQEWVGARDATILQAYPNGGKFVVARGNIVGIGAAAFAGASLVTLVLLLIRRKAAGGELGGGKCGRTFFTITLVLLWLGYVGFCVWYAYTNPGACD